MLSRAYSDLMQDDAWPIDNLYGTISVDPAEVFSANSSCLGYTLDAHDLLYPVFLDEKPNMENMKKLENVIADQLDFETTDNGLVDPESSVNLQPFLEDFGPDLGGSILEEFEEPLVTSTNTSDLQRISIIIQPDGKVYCSGDLTGALATLSTNWATQIGDTNHSIEEEIEEPPQNKSNTGSLRKVKRPSKLSERRPTGPLDKESDEYRLKRERNNVSVRQSRAKARQTQKETEKKVHLLTTENQRLSDKVDSLTKELNILRGLFGNVGANVPQEVDNFFAT